MEPFACTNCGDCCGPVPVNEMELKRIQNKLKRMKIEKRRKLQNQERPPLTCMFRDMEKDQCGIYEERPEICKMFGFYKNLKCPANPKHATIDIKEGVNRLKKGGKHVGILTLQIDWENIMKAGEQGENNKGKRINGLI